MYLDPSRQRSQLSRLLAQSSPLNYAELAAPHLRPPPPFDLAPFMPRSLELYRPTLDPSRWDQAELRVVIKAIHTALSCEDQLGEVYRQYEALMKQDGLPPRPRAQLQRRLKRDLQLLMQRKESKGKTTI